jgi:hypothetical protein
MTRAILDRLPTAKAAGDDAADPAGNAARNDTATPAGNPAGNAAEAAR